MYYLVTKLQKLEEFTWKVLHQNHLKILSLHPLLD